MDAVTGGAMVTQTVDRSVSQYLDRPLAQQGRPVRDRTNAALGGRGAQGEVSGHQEGPCMTWLFGHALNGLGISVSMAMGLASKADFLRILTAFGI